MTISWTVRLLREELQLLHEPGSYVGEVVKVMGKNKVLVKVQPEGKYSTYVRHNLNVPILTTLKLSIATVKSILKPLNLHYALLFAPTLTLSIRSSLTRSTLSYL